MPSKLETRVDGSSQETYKPYSIIEGTEEVTIDSKEKRVIFSLLTDDLTCWRINVPQPKKLYAPPEDYDDERLKLLIHTKQRNNDQTNNTSAKHHNSVVRFIRDTWESTNGIFIPQTGTRYVEPFCFSEVSLETLQNLENDNIYTKHAVDNFAVAANGVPVAIEVGSPNHQNSARRIRDYIGDAIEALGSITGNNIHIAGIFVRFEYSIEQKAFDLRIRHVI